MFARIFRGGCRGREPAVIKKVNASRKYKTRKNGCHEIEIHVRRSCIFLYFVVFDANVRFSLIYFLQQTLAFMGIRARGVQTEPQAKTASERYRMYFKLKIITTCNVHH
jgi:hypothetical protein